MCLNSYNFMTKFKKKKKKFHDKILMRQGVASYV